MKNYKVRVLYVQFVDQLRSNMDVIKYSELPEDIRRELYKYHHNYDETFEEFDSDIAECTTNGDLENFAEYVKEWGECEETVSGGYIISDYVLDTENYRFTVQGSQYIKDHGLCDFELNELVNVIPLSEIEEMITITKKEYDRLLEIESQFNKLSS